MLSHLLPAVKEKVIHPRTSEVTNPQEVLLCYGVVVIDTYRWSYSNLDFPMCSAATTLNLIPSPNF